MYSDDWLKAGYYKGSKQTLLNNKQINYVFWYDNNNEKVGITINFEYADDSHYELRYDEFLKLIDILGKGLAYTKILSDFFMYDRPLYEFSNLMKNNGIQFKEIHFY